jgi:hypothetical protein
MRKEEQKKEKNKVTMKFAMGTLKKSLPEELDTMHEFQRWFHFKFARLHKYNPCFLCFGCTEYLD